MRLLPGPHNLAVGLMKYVAVQSLIISVLSQGMHTLADEDTLMHHATHTHQMRLKGKATSLNLVDQRFLFGSNGFVSLVLNGFVSLAMTCVVSDQIVFGEC